MPQISPTAIVDATAEIADDVRVGPFTYVGPNVRIEPRCVIENNVTITGRTVVGAGTHVFPLAVIGAAQEASGECGECFLGEANAVREHVTVYSGEQGPTRIGNDNLIMISGQIGAGAAIGNHVIFANCTHLGARARVDDYVRTSGFTVVAPGVVVGAYAFTAGYSEVAHDVPPYAMVQGSPARVRGVNTKNLRRCGFGEDDIRSLKEAFRDLFDGATDQVEEAALRRLLDERPANPHVRRLLQALRDSHARRRDDD